MITAPFPSEEARRVPSGLHSTAPTLPAWPPREQTIAAVAGFQILTVLSHPPEAKRFPSGLQASEWTSLLWPRSVWISLPVSRSQILIVVSSPAEANRLPS